MKNTLTKVLLTIFGGGIALAAPIVPTDVQLAGSFDTKERVETHRKYLEERSIYITENADRLNLPQKTRDSAVVAKDHWEQKLLDDGFIDVKGGQVKEKPTKRQSLIETVVGMQLVERAYAFTFGKEDFESCGAIPCTFDYDGSTGGGVMALDSTSKVTGTDSARCDIPSTNDACAIGENLTSDTEYYAQFQFLLPTGWAFGVSSYVILFSFYDGVGSPITVNLEDFGTNRITLIGDELPFTDTGIDLALNTVYTIEIKGRISPTTGDVDLWVNNITEGSPTYNGSGTMNTGSDNITVAEIGGFHPDIVNDTYYDNVFIDTAFIGDGVPDSYIKSTLKGGLNVKGGGTLR